MPIAIRILLLESALTITLLVFAGASAGAGRWIVATTLAVLGVVGCFRIILRLEELFPD